MGFSLKKDFCLWVVPANDGRVRKVRFTARRAMLLAVLALSLSAGVMYLAGDYVRVQMIRARHFFSLKQVTAERDTLQTEKSTLQARLSELKEVNSRVLAYEQNVKQRLDELSSMIGVASQMGVIPVPEAAGKAPESPGGVGGAEVDCSLSGGGCDQELVDQGLPYRVPSKVSIGEDLVERLDRYMTLLRRVPLGAPGNGHVSSNYGYRRSPFSRRIRMHQGIDFSLPQGSEVRATADGVIKAVRRDVTYGLLVDISHSSKVVTRFAHLSKALVKKGQKVCRGQAIGLVGSTGRSTGPHLHYEVRLNKKPLDPSQLMQLARVMDESLF
jgi:murein DD-endopeptidase MepM/ murein hydrolase activator NlpD